jgi:N-methylhydantoinase A/oxoprolinase/acetone carboxylase beta subunit
MKVRIGVDVGGTFTKAVVLDNATHEILGKAAVLTTHDAPEGVARGVVEVFQRALQGFGVDPGDVVFLAHSTTQATNALLEGDVAPVGIVGMGGGVVEGFLARRGTAVDALELAPGRLLTARHAFLDRRALSAEAIRRAIEGLRAQGAKVIVASDAFSVDEAGAERQVMQVAADMGLPATGGHEISKLYGLTVRTRSAVINASILPKMMETAAMAESSIQAAGITAPLMIMRGDGGVMDAAEMRRRPILTMLSGPAASVAGALMHLRVSDGVFFEVGGTSTNIGVIRHGRPTLKYVELGGHRTNVHSLDVRVLGIAGGSLIRVAGREIVDVGPRSAHIAGLPYSAFAKPGEIEDPELTLVRPKPGDPDDYAAVRAGGRLFGLTTTCAANVLGLARAGDYSHGDVENARRAFAPLAARLGVSAEAAAERVLETAARKIMPLVETLLEEYRLDRGQVVLVGGGGGASALIPYTAGKLRLPYRIAEHAEVISSIGVALAMVQDVVERVIPNPQPEDLAAIKQEARAAAVRLGAQPESVEVYIDVDAARQRVRATALGATELRARDLRETISEDQARAVAAASFGPGHAPPELLARTPGLFVFAAVRAERWLRFFTRTRRPIRVVDRSGFVKLQTGGGVARQGRAADGLALLRRVWDETTRYSGDSVIFPEVFLGIGEHLLDLSGLVSWAQVEAVAAGELAGLPEDDAVVALGIPRSP